MPQYKRPYDNSASLPYWVIVLGFLAFCALLLQANYTLIKKEEIKAYKAWKDSTNHSIVIRAGMDKE